MSARDEIAALARRCEEGQLSAPVALMQMLIAGESDALVAEVLASVREATAAPASSNLQELEALLAANAEGCARVAAMLQSGVDVPPRDGTVSEGIAFCRRLFDWSVGQSEEASVALYSLGNPEILARATGEIVERLEAWGCLGPGRRALDLGCGIGRLEKPLSAALAQVDAVDVSPQMIAAAGRRAGALPNVTFRVVSGADLRGFADAAYDLVLAVDSMPYLVQSGGRLVDTHFAEVARVLRPGGDFVVLNFSYRGDLERDRREVSALAEAWGFSIVANGDLPFTLWDAAAFRLRRVLR